MIDLIRLCLPYLLLLYFVVKGIKEPFYFLGIPFLMFMSESIFFPGVKLFQIPGRLEFGLKFFWIIICWIISTFLQTSYENIEISKNQRLNALDYCIIGLILITLFGLGSTIFNYLILTSVFKEFIILISLFVSYFIIKNLSSRNKPEVLEKFLFSLLIVNSVASFLYLLHQGLHIKIYLIEEYLTEIFAGEEITRTFWFMPQFLFFSIAYSLVYREKRPFVFTVLLIINLLATFITYFRSFSIIAVCIFLLYFMLTGIKKGRIGTFLKNVFIFIVVGVLSFIMVAKFLPANTKYLLDRFSEITKPSLTREPNNLESRFTMTGIIISNIDENNKILGMGPVTENQLSTVLSMRQTTADMVWAGVIFRWGFLGLILFILLYIFSIIKAFIIYMKTEGVLSNLALLFLLYTISQSIHSFIDWTFMSGHGFAIGLWYFAMLSALVGFYENKELSDTKII